MIPTVGQAAAMNAMAYADAGEQEILSNAGWQRQNFAQCEKTGCVVVPWKHAAGTIYLAVRGSTCRSDILDDMRVFLGQPPIERIGFLTNYIQTWYPENLGQKTLLVGGHSLGGMVAMGAAAQWRLCGLLQNSPGWLINPPDRDSLEKLVEIRTGRDVVGAWGHTVPTTLIVHDHDVSQWNLSALHNVYRQQVLIREHGLDHLLLNDISLRQLGMDYASDADKTGTFAWMKETWRRVTRESILDRSARKSIGSMGISRPCKH